MNLEFTFSYPNFQSFQNFGSLRPMMKKYFIILFICFAISFAYGQDEQTFQISTQELQDKIKGGWAGQTIGCTFGGPTEFRFKGTFIQDYTPIPWYDGYLKETYENRPGLYDDIYMDLTFVDVLEKKGLDAPASEFARAFANASYPLWHANQAARYNILHGIMPPQSGHWLNNPHADDIDFQIEADFAGLMNPCMPNSAAKICDRVGHIMNYGDGWYGGVFVAGMYSLAFGHNDIDVVVRKALKLIPEQSTFHQCINDVINWCHQYPDDWKRPGLKYKRNGQKTWVARMVFLMRSILMLNLTPLISSWGCFMATGILVALYPSAHGPGRTPIAIQPVLAAFLGP